MEKRWLFVIMAYQAQTFLHKIKTCMNKRGFTIIELMITVVLIGFLATVGVTNYITIQQKARDGQRKADIAKMQSALEFYRSDQSIYKQQGSSPYRLNGTACNTSEALTSGSITYLQKIPCDPSGTSVFNSGNYYYYTQTSGTYYTFIACLEYAGDSQGTTTWPSGPPVVTGCASGTYYVVTSP